MKAMKIVLTCSFVLMSVITLCPDIITSGDEDAFAESQSDLTLSTAESEILQGNNQPVAGMDSVPAEYVIIGLLGIIILILIF